MAPMSTVGLVMLTENSTLCKYFFNKNRKRHGVRNINPCRHISDEFHHIYKHISQHPDGFFFEIFENVR